MLSIRVENLRSFKDTGEVEIKPITVLVGQNSSGKSTFLRTFPLFRQSIESHTRGPLLWYGQYVDLGDFKTALNNNSDKKEINFHFHFHIKRNNFLMLPANYRVNIKRQTVLDVKLMMAVADSSNKDEALINKYKIILSGHTIEMFFKDGNTVTDLLINSREFTNESKSLAVTQGGMLLCVSDYQDRVRSSYGSISIEKEDSNTAYSRVEGIVAKYLHRNTGRKKIRDLIDKFTLGTSAEMLDDIKNVPGSTVVWRNNVNAWTLDSSEFVSLQNAVIALNLSRIIRSCDHSIRTYALTAL